MGYYLARIIQLCNQIISMLVRMTNVLNQMLLVLTELRAGQKGIEAHLKRQDAALLDLKTGQELAEKQLDRQDAALGELKDGQDQIQEHLTAQDAILQEIARNTRPFSGATEVVFTVVIDGETKIGVHEVDIKVMQEFPVTVAFTDAFGNPANVEGAPTWETDNPQLLSVEADPDGMSAKVRSSVGVGSSQVTVRADADLGQGTKPIIGTLMVNVHAGDAVIVTLSPGEATDLPAPESSLRTK